MKKTLLIILIMLLLSGCKQGVASPIDLIKKPKVPGDQRFPSEQIYRDIPIGSKLIRPLKSNNLSAINYIDWNGDETREIYAFYRIASDNKLGVIVLSEADEGWQTLTTLEMAGSDINFANFVDFNGDGVKDLIMGLSMSGELFDALAVFEWQDGAYVEIYRDIYTHLTVEDITKDGIVDILLLRLDRNKEAFASLIAYRDGLFQPIDTIDLDEYIIGYYNVIFGKATPDITGLFIDKQLGSNYTTNIIVYREGRLELAFDEQPVDFLPAQLTKPYQIASRDVNGDGIIEIGSRLISQLQTLQVGEEPPYLDTWYQWDGGKALKLVLTVYESKQDKFRFVFPERWAGAVSSGQLVFIPARAGAQNRFLHIYYTVSNEDLYKLLTIEKIAASEVDAKRQLLTENDIPFVNLAADEENAYLAYYQKNSNIANEEYRKKYQALFLSETELAECFELID